MCRFSVSVIVSGLLVVAQPAVAPRPAGAQSVTVAAISGTVRDPSGAVVRGALVTLRHVATNHVTQATTDERGEYRLPHVPVGACELRIGAEGFATVVVALTLGVGQAIDVPVELTAAGVSEAVSVVGQAPLVDAVRTQMADAVTPDEVKTLPLNGRNYLDLALLVPNVSRTNTRSGERFAETSAVPGTGISVAGQRNLASTFIVDGLSANDDAADLAGTYYAQEVIREFQVVTSGGTAEFGRASAGTVNIVTQSGGNTVGGRGYGFFRDDSLDAPNALATTKDPLSQQQYGLTLSGPLRRDRMFWFANAERTVQDKTGFVTITSANVDAVNAALDAAGYGGPRVAGGPFPTGYRTANFFGRFDRQHARSRLQARYSVYDVGSPNARGVGGLSDVSRGTRLDALDQNVSVGFFSLLSPTFTNEVRAQYIRSELGAPPNDMVGPAVSISGVANLGTSTTSPVGRDLDVVQIADIVTVQRGRHLAKAGLDLLYNRVRIEFPGALQGTYTFSSAANLARGVYVQFQQAFGTPSFAQTNPNLGLFLQDEWRPRPDLTVNAGLRYDLQWLPAPIALDANNVSPRIGVAWAPGDGRTVVRASGGVYFDAIPLRATSNALQRDGVNYKVAVLSFGQAGAPVFPAVLPAFPQGTLTAVTAIDRDIQNGRSHQAGVQVERAIRNVASAAVGYSYLRGHGIIMSRNINVPTLTAAEAAAQGVPNLGRPNPDFANISRYESIGESWFHGLTVSLSTRGAPWGATRVSYTLSKSEDTSGNAFFSQPQDADDVAAERGPSDNDQRHRVVFSGSVGGTAATERVGRALGGLQIGYVLSYATGVPFNVQTGNDRNNDTNVNDRPAGVGRNSARQSATSSFDLRISRVFEVGRQQVEVMVEAFNVFNHLNVIAVNNTFGTLATPLPSFGQATVAGDPRQLQLGARWSF
jgi:hypothetical protein